MAQALPLARSSISRTVTKPVDRGLIQRRRLLSDRRVVILTLTQEGMTLTQDLHRRVQAFEAEVCRSVSDKRWGSLLLSPQQSWRTMLPWCNRGFRNPRLEKGQYRSCSRTTQARKKSRSKPTDGLQAAVLPGFSRVAMESPQL